MDSGATMIGLAFVLLCTIPFILLSRHKSKKKKKLLRGLEELAKQANSTLDEFDFWKTMAIGIDRSNKQLFYFQHRGESLVKQHINLLDVVQCRVMNKSNVVNSKDSSFTVADHLGLSFSYSDKLKADTMLEFYNIDFDGFTAADEVILTEKWAKIVSDCITDTRLKK